MNIVVNFDGYKHDTGTTGFYVRKAVEELGHTLVDEPQSEGVVTSEADVAINVEPCTERFVKAKRTAFWEMDTYRHRQSRQYDEFCDYVFFVSAPHYVHSPKEAWLPVAADPTIHWRTREPDFDICFVGRIDSNYPLRSYLLDVLKQHYSVIITGTQPGMPYSEAMSRGKLIFNCSISDDVNMRFFEGMAIGCLVTNYLPHQDSLANPFEHFIPYRNEAELLRLCDYYLAHEDERLKMADASRRLVLERHTYQHRVNQILRWQKSLS